MTKEEIILFEKKLYEEYSKKLKNVREEFLKNSEIQVGTLIYKLVVKSTNLNL